MIDTPELRAALRDPAIRRIRRDLGLATPAQIASGELAGPEEEARLREAGAVAVRAAAQCIAGLREVMGGVIAASVSTIAQMAAIMGTERRD